MNKLDDFRFQRGIDLLLRSSARIERGRIWLDLGCHQGQFLKKLIAEHGVIGVGADIWDPKQKSPEDDHWDYFKCDLDRELPWSGSADFISALEVLEHMVDTDGFLDRIYNALKHGGWVLISTPNINCLRNRVTGLYGTYPTGLEYRTVIHHVRLYNVSTLRRHLLERKFERVAVIGVSFLPLSLACGTGPVSQALANLRPELCNNIIAIARKPC